MSWFNPINNDNIGYYEASQINETANERNGTSVKLTSVNGATYTSTLTVVHVLPDYDKKMVVCSDKIDDGEEKISIYYYSR